MVKEPKSPLAHPSSWNKPQGVLCKKSHGTQKATSSASSNKLNTKINSSFNYINFKTLDLIWYTFLNVILWPWKRLIGKKCLLYNVEEKMNVVRKKNHRWNSEIFSFVSSVINHFKNRYKIEIRIFEPWIRPHCYCFPEFFLWTWKIEPICSNGCDRSIYFTPTLTTNLFVEKSMLLELQNKLSLWSCG